MLNGKRTISVLLATAILCVATAGSSAAEWETLSNGCRHNTESDEYICPKQNAGSPGTSRPAYQPSEDQIQTWRKISNECQRMEEESQRAEATGLYWNLDSHTFYQNHCVATTSPEVAAREVVASMQLPTPSVGMTPRPGPDSVILVGYNVWMWVDPGLFEPVSAVATLDGTSIGVTGRVAWVDWDMGDGNVVRCTGPGTPYVLDRDGLAASPDCGHVYTNKQGDMTVTATAHWVLEWFGGGRSGTLTDTTVSTIPVTVGEWQVLLKRA